MHTPSAPRAHALRPLTASILLAFATMAAHAQTGPSGSAQTAARATPVSAQSDQLEATVVTGTRTPHLIDDVPVETIVISKETIARSGATNLGQALRLVRGFNSTALDDTLAADNISTTFRGLNISMGYGVILIDGKRNWGGGIGAHGGTLHTTNRIPLSMVERIEVVKGSSSSLYGADAMAGVINVITRKTPSKPTVTASVSRGRYKVRAARGTDLSKAASQVVDPDRDSLNYSAAVGAPLGERAGFMLFYDRRQDEGNARLPQKALADSVLLKGRVKLSDTLSLEMDIGKDWQKKENAVAPGTRPPAERYERKYNTTRASLGLTYKQGPHHWVTTLNGQRQKFSIDLNKASGTAKNAGIESVYTYYGNAHWLTVGGEVRQDDFHQYVPTVPSSPRRPRPSYTVAAKVTNYALFVQDEMRLLDKRLTLVPGVRFERHSRYGNNFSPKLSAMYDFGNELKMRAAVGSSFKSPSLPTLYTSDIRNHGNHYLQANPNLRAEKAITASIGVEKRWQDFPLWANLGTFQSNVKDMIGSRYSGRNYPGTTLPIDVFVNVDKVAIRGLEAAWELGHKTGPYLHGTLGLTRSKVKSGVDAGKELRRTPRFEATLSPGYNAPSGSWGTQLTWTHIGRQYENATNTSIARAHHVVDASAWVNIPTGGTRQPLRLALNLSNLGNSDKGTRAGRYRTGRSANLTLSGAF
ncbi:MAG: TonB-dependent receptor [Brachymonas sp.]|nr:TonB-dependent receptor [Brachymonas sp.]